MGVKFQMTSPLKVHIRFSPQKSCIHVGKVSTEIAQRIVKFQILDFAIFSYGNVSFKQHLL